MICRKDFKVRQHVNGAQVYSSNLDTRMVDKICSPSGCLLRKTTDQALEGVRMKFPNQKKEFVNFKAIQTHFILVQMTEMYDSKCNLPYYPVVGYKGLYLCDTTSNFFTTMPDLIDSQTYGLPGRVLVRP